MFFDPKQPILSFTIYHLPPGFLSRRKEEPLPELFPQTPVLATLYPGGGYGCLFILF